MSAVAYADFLAQKLPTPPSDSVPVASMPSILFDFQKELVEWTVRSVGSR